MAKHADADRVAVELDEPDESIRLRVTDDGRGIAEEEIGGAGSLGILGIRERARALGGRVALSGEPGEKTVASVRLPYPENADHEDAETRDSDD